MFTHTLSLLPTSLYLTHYMHTYMHAYEHKRRFAINAYTYYLPQPPPPPHVIPTSASLTRRGLGICVYVHMHMYIYTFTRAVVMRTGRRAELLGVKLGCPRSHCRAVVSDVLCVLSYVHFVCVCVYMCMCIYMYIYIYAYKYI